VNNFFSWGNLLISFCSLVISFIALRRSIHAQNEANAIQKKLVFIEEQREYDRKTRTLQARLCAELRKKIKGYWLYLINFGEAEAHNVRIKLDGIPLINHPAAVQGMHIPSFIGPNSEVGCPLSITQDCYPPFEVEIKWDDNYSKDRIYRSTLTF